jgi:hypothetical protein
MANAGAVETPEKKQNFDWIYLEKNPVAYKTEILDGRTYICDNNTRLEFDRLILPHMETLAKSSGIGKARVVDLGTCFGNTALALLNGMETSQIQENWKDANACEKINFARRFPAHCVGIDISESSLEYTKRTGICDEIIPANLNSQEGLNASLKAVRDCEILISTATLVYLNLDSVETLVKEFAAGGGEGYAIVNFLNPFELEKTDQMKAILLKHLDFVGSTATQHRTMSPIERKNYPKYGDWALLEIWTLKRRRARM